MRKTTDGGATWGYARLSVNELNALLIDPSNHTALYAATDNGVLQSADGGDTWNAAGLANTNVSLLALDPPPRNVLYAVTTAVYPDKPGFAGLLQSTDRGATWTPANAGLDDLIANRAQVNALIVNPGRAGVLYLAATG